MPRNTLYRFEPGAFNIHCWRCKKKIKSTKAILYKDRWYCSNSCRDVPNELVNLPEDHQGVELAQDKSAINYRTDITKSYWENIASRWELIGINWEDIDDEQWTIIG